MTSVLTKPKLDVEPKEYLLEGHVYMTITGEAMGYIEAARTVCKIDEPLELLRIAVEMAQGKYRVLLNLYTYARFEFDIHPGELNMLFRDSVFGTSMPVLLLRKISTQAGTYWNRRGKYRKDTKPGR
jgi:hypothetical protein